MLKSSGYIWEDYVADEQYRLIADMKLFRGNAIITNLRAEKSEKTND